MEDNGKRRIESPIEYPKIEIPTLGTYVVRFDMGAIYTLERDFGMPDSEVIKALKEWLPRTVEIDGVKTRRLGNASVFRIFDMLSACIADGIEIKPRRLATLFEPDKLGDIVNVLMDSYSKTPWPKAQAPESAGTEPEPKPNDEALPTSVN